MCVCSVAVQHKTRKPSLKKQGKKRKLSPLLLGPKPFALDRMIAIFQAIAEGDLVGVLLRELG